MLEFVEKQLDKKQFASRNKSIKDLQFKMDLNFPYHERNMYVDQ